MFEHQDILSALNGKLPLPDKIGFVHNLLKERFDFVERISVAIYDPKTDLLKTFLHSSGGGDPLSLYSARLSESVSLQKILKTGRPRLVNDLDLFRNVAAKHSRNMAAQQYRSSYTMPMFLNGELFGFLFFDSTRKGAFEEAVLHYLDIVGHLLSLMVIHELSAKRNLMGVVQTATTMVGHRDFETGAHLNRMSSYARLISIGVAKKYSLNDEIIEHIFMFSPLHDIGKIGIADSILLKPGKLTEAEFGIMKTHAAKGGEIVDMMLENLGLDGFPHSDILHNIARYHHEAINGSGYHGLKDDEIPVEAKIVAVADVFDALTSARPYKKIWSNDEAFGFLQSMAGTRFDGDCVAALMNERIEVEAIQKRFHEDHFG